ncbi:MAG: double-strand break repair helicase AddA [Pseudomonadota bacterium]
MSARKIPDVVINTQIAASDPATSAWVAANAGSGKTHVLAQRVIRLLLAGCDPSTILCITFTKAAAANMSNRVFGILREWTALTDAELDHRMTAMGVRRIDARQRERARRLFALALETPGGLKVQTVHAFCTSLLHLFPFEANVAARFEVLDETTENTMLERISLAVMLEAASNPDSALGKALSVAILAAADITFRDMVREVIRSRDKLVRWVEAAGGVPEAMAQLSRALGVEPDETAASVNAAFFESGVLARSEWASIAAALGQGSKTDIEQGGRFASLAKLEGSEPIETYLDIFCTKDRSKTKERLATKAIQTEHPALCERLTQEQARVWGLLQRQRAIAARDRSAALFTIAYAVIKRVETEKNRRGLLDYDDLIDKTLDLLQEPGAAWVHYKLDRGIHHVLVDEAQDTSPKQWAIVKALVSEFFAGKGAHERPRTIFAVGDEKQSIFSFQGAVPQEFSEMRKHFEGLHQKSELEFVATEFKHSFRSGPNVLGAVDTVFARVEAYRGLTADLAPPVHESLPDAAPGLVEIWDTEKPDTLLAIEGWDAPFDTQTTTSPVVRLANRIASHVKQWRGQGTRPGDVLVLVRRRGPLFEAIIRALKNAGIPVAGADRLVLTEHIAVMDLMVLADALLLPDDDLALATILKSPLIGMDDEQLFEIAWNRKGSLRQAVREKGPALAARLDEWTMLAREQTPFAFYAELLGAGQGRKKFLARLGHEATDALDEFLNLALDYERQETPSLQGFIAWLRAAQSEVKRDMEIARDEVRVMTVHGAKGLEAKVVILADTTTPPAGWHPPRLLKLPAQNVAPGTPDRLVWAGSKAADAGAMSAARDAAALEAQNEYRRLLYVAMTRAIERLVVCGIDGERKRPEGCWYDLARDALEGIAVFETADDGAGQVLRFRKEPERDSTQKAHEEKAPQAVALPSWLEGHVAAEPSPPQPLTPSTALDETLIPSAAGNAAERKRAMARGTAAHRLMQSLPDIPREQRAASAQKYLARQENLDGTDRATIQKQVLAILDDARFAPLFASGSRAEVPIVGTVAGRPVPGLVDRLVVTPEAVLIADYKTNRAPPRSLAETLSRYAGYVAQLALYREVLGKLYPGRPVRAALVWTETPELLEIPAKELDSALKKLTSA